MSVLAHFFMSVTGSNIHERLAHFFVDIYRNKLLSADFPIFNNCIKTLKILHYFVIVRNR